MNKPRSRILILRKFTKSQNPSKLQLKSLFLPPQRTLDLEYQDGGDELQNLITEITAMRDPGLFISVVISLFCDIVTSTSTNFPMYPFLTYVYPH